MVAAYRGTARLAQGQDGADELPRTVRGEPTAAEPDSGAGRTAYQGEEFGQNERDALVLLQRAIEFSDRELHGPRTKAWKYYNGGVDVPSKLGRSKVVKTEVRDAVEMLMPPIMSTLLGSEFMVEFQAKDRSLLDKAHEDTCAIDSIFFDENDGWNVVHDAIKTSLITRTVMLKVYEEENESTEEFTADNDDNIYNPFQQDALSSQGYMEQAGGVYSRTISSNTIKVEAIAAEEILISQDAKNSSDAQLVGTRRMITFGELYDLGFGEETLALLGEVAPAEMEDETEARTGLKNDTTTLSQGSRNIQELLIHEYVVKLGAPVKKYHVFSTLSRILRIEEITDDYNGPDFIVFSAVRIPNSAIGRSPTDQTIPLQDIGSTLFRQVLDNLYWSNTPAIEAVKSAVNPFQLQNWNFGTVFDTKMPNAIRPLTIPFVADKAVPFMDWLEKQREQRTGGFKDALGLNPQLMQNQSASASIGIMTAAQRQIEMYVRVVAENAIKPVYRCIYRRLFGQDIPHKIKAKVGIGHSSLEDRMQSLLLISQKQEQAIMQFGIENNPVCSIEHYIQTLREIVRLSRYFDPSAFFNDINTAKQKLEILKQQPKPPTPEQVKLQIEQQKAQINLQTKQAELGIKQQGQQADIQLQQAQAQQNAAIEQAKTQNEIQLERLRLQNEIQLDRERMMNEIQIERMKMQHEMALREQEAQHEAMLEAYRVKHETRAGQGNIPRD